MLDLSAFFDVMIKLFRQQTAVKDEVLWWLCAGLTFFNFLTKGNIKSLELKEVVVFDKVKSAKCSGSNSPPHTHTHSIQNKKQEWATMKY